MSRPTRYFYEVKDENKIYYLDESTGEFGSCLTYQKDMKYNYFHLFKDDQQNQEGLLLFHDKFNVWCKQLEKHGIYYKKYYNHYNAVEFTFKRYSSDIKYDFDAVSFDEFELMEKCYNGGLIYLNPEYKNQTLNSFGYDYSSFYPNVLVDKDFKIPTKQGIKKHITHFDFENLQYGIYKVKITCENEEFRKVFAFSRDNTYTHYSLLFAKKYQETFNVNIELITATEFNALVYKNEDLVNSKTIFNNWFSKLYNIKSKCSKDNYLVKRLLSSLWGSLTKCEKKYFNDAQMEDETEQDEYEIIKESYYHYEGELKTRFECVRKSKPYKFELARMKPFMLSFSRNIVGEIILHSHTLENVVRINTDGIVLSKEFDFPALGIPYYPKPEDKTTGLIKWNNVNNYFKEAS